MVVNTKINNDIKPNFWENLNSVSKIIVILFLILIIIKGGYDLSNGAHIFGDKNTSFFDAWSLEHIITGMSLSYFFLLFKGPFNNAMKKDDEKEFKKLEKSKNFDKKQLKEIKKLLERKTIKNKIIHHSLIVIGIAFAWEIIELYMEVSHFNQTGIELYFYNAQQWFSGVELFLNRIFVDVFLVYLGWYFVRHKPVLSQIAAPISLLWLTIHIIVFGDSMFLHKYDFYTIINTLFSLNTLYAFIIVGVITLFMNNLKNNLKNKNV